MLKVIKSCDVNKLIACQWYLGKALCYTPNMLARWALPRPVCVAGRIPRGEYSQRKLLGGPSWSDLTERGSRWECEGEKLGCQLSATSQKPLKVVPSCTLGIHRSHSHIGSSSGAVPLRAGSQGLCDAMLLSWGSSQQLGILNYISYFCFLLQREN